MFLFEILRKFNLNPNSSFSSLFSLPSPSLSRRGAAAAGHLTDDAYPGKPRQGATLNGPRLATDRAYCWRFAPPISRPYQLTRAMRPLIPDDRATTRRRRRALAATLSRLRLPPLCRAYLHLLLLCAYKRAAPSPCSHMPEYHHHPTISASTRPRRQAPLSAPPPPKPRL
jgi:hypothetical protein